MMLSLFAARAFGVTPITPWTQGIATNYGGAQDGLEPDQPSFGTKDVRPSPRRTPSSVLNLLPTSSTSKAVVAQGSCGYAMLDKGTWPYWSVAAISTSNSFYLAGPTEACG